MTLVIKGLYVTLSMTMLCHYAESLFAEFRYAECHYAECRYAECRGTILKAHLMGLIAHSFTILL